MATRKPPKKSYGAGTVDQRPDGRYRGRVMVNGERHSVTADTAREVRSIMRTLRDDAAAAPAPWTSRRWANGPTNGWSTTPPTSRTEHGDVVPVGTVEVRSVGRHVYLDGPTVDLPNVHGPGVGTPGPDCPAGRVLALRLSGTWP